MTLTYNFNWWVATWFWRLQSNECQYQPMINLQYIWIRIQQSNVSCFQVDITDREPLNWHASSPLMSATCPYASRWDVKWFAGMCTAVPINAWKSAVVLAQLIKDVEQMEKTQVVTEFGKTKMKHLDIISASHFPFANSFNFSSFPDFEDIPSCTPTPPLTVGCMLLSDTGKPNANVDPFNL